jgi:hypothetical protein
MMPHPVAPRAKDEKKSQRRKFAALSQNWITPACTRHNLRSPSGAKKFSRTQTEDRDLEKDQTAPTN